MAQIREFAVVCLVLVLIGSSVSLAVTDSSQYTAPTSKQTAALAAQTGSAEMQILPEEHSILRDQPMTFAIRVVSDGEDGLLLGFRIRTETVAKFEFHNPDARTISASLIYPNYDAVVYIPAENVGTEEYVPVTVSPEKKFPRRGATVEATRISRDLSKTLTANFTFGIRCPVECRAELMVQWATENADLVIAILSLLIAFFGRKKIWSILRTPRKQVASTVDRKQNRGNRSEREPDE